MQEVNLFDDKGTELINEMGLDIPTKALFLEVQESAPVDKKDYALIVRERIDKMFDVISVKKVKLPNDPTDFPLYSDAVIGHPINKAQRLNLFDTVKESMDDLDFLFKLYVIREIKELKRLYEHTLP